MNPLLNPTTAIIAVFLTALAILVIRTDWETETEDLRDLLNQFRKHLLLITIIAASISIGWQLNTLLA